MKTLLILALLPMTLNVMAETKIVKPNLKLGHWVTTIDNSAMMNQALAGVPEGEDRTKARAMMQAYMPKTIERGSCLTANYFNEIVESMSEAENTGEGCKTDVLESSRKKMVMVVKCDEGGIKVTTDFISSKRYESTIVTDMLGDGRQNEITTTAVAQWQAADCPANLASTANTANTANNASVSLEDTAVGREVGQQSQRQKNRVKSRAQRAEDRAADKAVDKVIDKVFGKFF